MWKCGKISKFPDFQISKSFGRVGNLQYITNLQGLQKPPTAGLDISLLTFYTSDVIKLYDLSRASAPAGHESREGEDRGHEQNHWHRPGDDELRGGGDGRGRTRGHHQSGGQSHYAVRGGFHQIGR